VTDPLLAGGKLVWDMIAGLLGAHDKNKVDLFNNHVEPLQQRVALIHKNYTQAFLELRSGLRSGDFKLTDAVRFLEQRRQDFQYERDLATKVAARLSDAERRPVRADAWSDVQKYCIAIDHYLSSPYDLHRTTFFTSLLETAMREGERTASNYRFVRTIEELQAESTPQLVSREFAVRVDALIDHVLPQAIATVNDAYARLRALLL
jgi:hypothetical protein